MYIERSCMADALLSPHCSLFCSRLHALLSAPRSALGSTLCSRIHALLSAPRSALGSTLCSQLHALLSAPRSAIGSTLCSRPHADRCLLWPAVASCLVVSLPSTA
ncbi:unnamed protein product [Gadus morhua 'NCC']